MNFKKILIVLAALISLTVTGMTIMGPQKVEAHSIWWWEKPHKAVITAKTKINHIVINSKYPMGHKSSSTYLEPGQLVWIRKIDNMGTVVTWNGKAFSRYNYWASYNYSNDWFELQIKQELIDTGLFHGAKKQSNKCYVFTWKQYCKLVKMGMWDLMDHPYGPNHTKILNQIKKWNVKPEKVTN